MTLRGRSFALAVAVVMAVGALPAQSVATPIGAVAAAPSMTAAAPSVPGAFVSVAPQRLLDTRSGVGAAGPVVKSGTVHLQVTGRGGVPATGVSAVVMNVTVTAPSGSGYITAYPDGTPLPTASNLNFVKGQTVPNLVTVKVGTNGKVALRNGSGGTVQLIADVAGYYLDGAPSVPGAFVSVAPQRLLDTRSGVGAAGPVVKSGTVHLQVTGRGGVPATGVSAVVMNVTVTAPSGSGYITAYPDGTPLPTASNLNFVKGQTVPNLVTVKVGTNGKVALRNGSGGTVQLIADVAGYYLDGAPSVPGAFVSVAPQRLLDTRSGVGAAGPVVRSGTVHLQVTGRGGVPATGVSAVVMNVTVTAPSGSGYITAYPDGTPLPTASNLNFVKGQTVPNLVTVKVGTNGKVALRNGSGGTVQLIADVAGYYLDPVAVDTTPPSPVTTVTLTGTTSSTVALSWTNPADADLQGVMVRRATGATAPTSPTAGTLVADVPKGTTTLTDTALSPGTQYSYAFFAHDAVPNYATAATKTATTTAVADTTPPGPVTTVTLTGTTSSSVSLSWTNPADADLQGVMVRRATGATAPTSPTAGTLVADVPKGTTTLTDTALSPGTQYSYAFFAHDAVPNYATAATKTATTTAVADTTPPGPVTTVTLTGTTSSSVSLSWTNPADADLQGVMVRRATGATAPTSPTAGTLVADVPKGTTTLTDTALSPGTQYSYAFFAHDAVPNYATAVAKTATTTTLGCDPTVIHVGGSVATDTTWTASQPCGVVYVLDADIRIEAEVTLTINQGGIVKAATDSMLTVAGSLVVNGTEADPVVFTSLLDDSVGGDTNGDGGATVPAAGAWYGIYVPDGGVFSIDHADLRFGQIYGNQVGVSSLTHSRVQHVAGTAISVSTTVAVTVSGNRVSDVGSGISVRQDGDARDVASSTTTVTDNVVDGVHSGSGIVVGVAPVLLGASVLTNLPAPTVTGNVVNGSSGTAISVAALNLLPSRLVGNTGSANTVNALELRGTLRDDLTLPVDGLQIVIGQGNQSATGGLIVGEGVTLTAQAGTVLKAWPESSPSNSSMLTVAGSLVVNGTEADPVVFTSLLDDSVGGDTNGDGGATVPAAGAWYGIYVPDGGVFSIDHADLRFGQIYGNQVGVSSLTHSRVQHVAGTAISVSTTVAVTVSGNRVSDVGSGISVRQDGDARDVASSTTTVTDNVVDGVHSGSGIVVGVAPVLLGASVLTNLPAPTVTGNVVNGSSGTAISVAALNLLPSRLVGNTGSANTVNALELRGTLRDDLTLPVDGLQIVIGQGNQSATGGLIVGEGVTLTAQAGTVLKAWPESSPSNSSMLTVAGSLVVNGTEADPVVFTSLLDDSVGGDTNGDGGATVPAAGAWYGIYVPDGGAAILDGADIRYASIALRVNSGAVAELHGSVAKSAFGVEGSDSFVDATRVDWGDASGPAPIGSGVGYLGTGVLVIDWVGWVPPPPPESTPNYSPPTTHACKKIAFLGARGSGEDPQGDPLPYFASTEEGLGDRVPGVLFGLKTELDTHAFGSSSNMKVLGVQYRALGVISNPFRMLYDADFSASIYEGVNKITQMVQDEAFNCPEQKIVLAGYSQGALSIHIALRILERTAPSALESIVGVGLISDPAKTRDGAEATLEAYDRDYFNSWAGSGVTAAEGVWTKYMYGSDTGPLPPLIAERTIAMCRNHDPVCATPNPLWLTERLIFSTSLHTDQYYVTHTDVLGRWIADQYLGIPFQMN